MSSSLPYEVNCSILFTELPLLERPAAVKRAGFDGVEFWWPFEEAVPADKDVDAFVAAVQDAGVELVGLNFFAGDMPGGDRGLVSWPARSAEFRDNIDVTVGIGERLGCKAFNALYGNRVEDCSPKRRTSSARRTWHSRQGPRRGSAAPFWWSRSAARRRTRCSRPPTRSRSSTGRASPTSDCSPTSTTWRSTATTSTRSSPTTPTGSPTCRSPTPRVATSPAPASLPLLRQLADLEAAGYRGWVGLEYKPSAASADSFGWIRASPRLTGATEHA